MEGSSALVINPPPSFQSAATTLWADQLFCVFDFLPSSLATSSYSLSPTNHNHSSELVNFLAHPASVSHHPLLALWHSMHVHGDDEDGEKDNDGTVTIPEGHLCWMGSRGSRSDYSMHSVTLPLCPDHPHNGLSQTEIGKMLNSSDETKLHFCTSSTTVHRKKENWTCFLMIMLFMSHSHTKWLLWIYAVMKIRDKHKKVNVCIQIWGVKYL